MIQVIVIWGERDVFSATKIYEPIVQIKEEEAEINLTLIALLQQLTIDREFHLITGINEVNESLKSIFNAQEMPSITFFSFSLFK